MIRRCAILLAVLGTMVWAGSDNKAQAQDTNLSRYYYYPYYYYPHNYWPSQGPKWPEQPGASYVPNPAYMSYPPYRAPFWRYEHAEPQNYYRGFHFWLDQF